MLSLALEFSDANEECQCQIVNKVSMCIGKKREM